VTSIAKGFLNQSALALSAKIDPKAITFRFGLHILVNHGESPYWVMEQRKKSRQAPLREGSKAASHGGA
jgi:hypothetical protein